jgi:hypothetical protein
MPDVPESQPPSVPELQAKLQDIAASLRHSTSLDSAAQHALSELVQELGRALAAAPLPPEEVAHLADTTAHLAEALHHERDRGLIGKAVDRFEGALVNAETHAPNVVGVARRFLDALSNWGI